MKDNINRAHMTGIFIISLAVLAYQVLLTRLFSVVLYYHFAFVGISLAMLGMTIGAIRVYTREAQFAGPNMEKEWAKSALGFSLSAVLLTLWFLYSPWMVPDAFVARTVIASLVLFVIPFIYSGICVTLILTKSSSGVGWLYAADLCGAALGCIAVVGVLFYVDPVCIILGLAALSSYAAWRMVRLKHEQLARCSALLAAFWMAGCILQGGLYLTDSPHLRVVWAKLSKQEDVQFERWNAFSRVRVIPYASTQPFGWGYGIEEQGPIEQKYLDIDADASTIITHFDGDLKPLAFLAEDIINMGYHIRPVKEVTVIGVGGGRDIMSALYFGAQKIYGIELNPAIIEAVTKTFADFTGHFTERPEVKIINAEARTWLSQHRQQSDLVQISLIDTWAATAAGGLTLSENKIYTVEAWQEFLKSLKPHGMLVVSRWYDSNLHIGEFYRLLSLAVQSLENQGIPVAEVRQHILSFSVGRIVTVVASPTPFSPAEVARASQVAKERHFTVMISPDYAWDETSGMIASGKADTSFYDHLPLDVTAPTDNRPFFFYMTRMKDLLLGSAKDYAINIYDSGAVKIVGVLLLATSFCVIMFVILPLWKLPVQIAASEIWPHLLYFAVIGLGFMLIEISQMQRLMIFLGHPVYGLSVVLFTLLLFGGIGSATVSSEEATERLWLRAVLLCLMLCITGMATPLLADQMRGCGTLLRILLSVALLAPAGFCMGMMFPIGMAASATRRELQPWFWGVNGVTSVFASVLGSAISMEYGIATAYWLGVGCYIICALLAFRNGKRAA